MADTKISALTAATTPLAGTEVLPIVQSGVTKQVSVANLTAGRAVSGLSFTATGNVTGAALIPSGTTVPTNGWYLPSANVVAIANNSGFTANFDASRNFNLGQATSALQSGGTGITIYGSSYAEIKFLNSTTGTAATDGTAFVNSGLGFAINNREAGSLTLGTSNTVRLSIDSGGDITASTGNIIQGTAAKGFNFTANTGAAGMTSQLLNWYEEGTWTPVLKFSGATTGITYSTQTGKYTRVGRLVTAYCKVVLSNKGSASGSAEIYGLPFTLPTSGINVPVSVYASNVTYSGSLNFHAEGTTDRIALQQITEAGTVTYLNDGNFSNTSTIEISISYMV